MAAIQKTIHDHKIPPALVINMDETSKNQRRPVEELPHDDCAI
jgi:hypothetical protein